MIKCIEQVGILKESVTTLFKLLIKYVPRETVGRDSLVSIMTRYRLDDLGFESRWERDFPHLSRRAHPASYTVGTGSFPGIKWPGRGVDHPPSLAPR
jgi:hypothetical protein